MKNIFYFFITEEEITAKISGIYMWVCTKQWKNLSVKGSSE